MIVYPVVGAFVIAVFVLAVRRSGLRDRWVALGALAVAGLLPIVLTLATLEGRGVIWQGRYGLPYGVGFVLIAGFLIAQGGLRPLPWSVTVPTAALFGVAVAACLIKVRSDELSDNVASRTDPAWHEPFPAILALLALAASALFAMACSRQDHERA